MNQSFLNDEREIELGNMSNNGDVGAHACRHASLATDSLKTLFMRSPLFDNIQEGFIDAIIDGLDRNPHRFLKDEYIMKKGNRENWAYMLQYGSAQVLHDDGKEIRRLHHGDFFGEKAALSNDNEGRRTVSIKALTEVVVLKVSKEVIHRACHTFPDDQNRLEQLWGCEADTWRRLLMNRLLRLYPGILICALTLCSCIFCAVRPYRRKGSSATTTIPQLFGSGADAVQWGHMIRCFFIGGLFGAVSYKRQKLASYERSLYHYTGGLWLLSTLDLAFFGSGWVHDCIRKDLRDAFKLCFDVAHSWFDFWMLALWYNRVDCLETVASLSHYIDLLSWLKNLTWRINAASLVVLCCTTLAKVDFDDQRHEVYSLIRPFLILTVFTFFETTMRLLWKCRTGLIVVHESASRHESAKNTFHVSPRETVWAKRVVTQQYVSAAISLLSATIYLFLYLSAYAEVGITKRIGGFTVAKDLSMGVKDVVHSFVLVALSGLFGSKFQYDTDANAHMATVAPNLTPDIIEQNIKRLQSDAQCSEQTTASLAHRSLPLSEIIAFYKTLGSQTMKWFDPERSTTKDVVCAAVIPKSREDQCSPLSYAEYYQKKNNEQREKTLPDCMVTHWWGNLFSHLVAAVIADAMGDRCYEDVLASLTGDSKRLQQKGIGKEFRSFEELMHELEAINALGRRYWICAFCVNQHVTTCNQGDTFDSVTQTHHQTCDCELPKVFEGPACEVDKFDSMIAKLVAKKGGTFSHLVAVDQGNETFGRAWCVSEIAKAHALKVHQQFVMYSDENTRRHFYKIRRIDVKQCRASREEDKVRILRQIEKDEGCVLFNKKVRSVVLNFTKYWLDCAESMDQIGRILLLSSCWSSNDEPRAND